MLVGERYQALHELHGFITAKSTKSWTPVMDELMTLFFDLSIEEREKNMINDGLRYFKTLTLSNHSNSLIKIVEYTLSTAEKVFAKETEKSKETSENEVITSCKFFFFFSFLDTNIFLKKKKWNRCS